MEWEGEVAPSTFELGGALPPLKSLTLKYANII